MSEPKKSYFPADFFWGAATSSYQVEGDNINSDWWEWEQRLNLKEKSGQATRHYQLYKEDFDLAKALNHNAHRLSIEWSRIEPRDSEFSRTEIEHYVEVIKYLKGLGIEPIVTLHHFTNPQWIAQRGGWLDDKTVDYFLRYVAFVINSLGRDVRYWITINEPNVYVHHSYIIGEWPPQEKSFSKARRALKNIIKAHVRSYRLIKKFYKDNNLACPQISIAQNMQAFVPCTGSLLNRISAMIRSWLYDYYILNQLARKHSLDFIGINYYSRTLVDVASWRIKNIMFDECSRAHHPLRKNSLGWDIYPQGLYDILLGLKRYGLKIFIMENGICTDDDNLRWDFIKEHLLKISSAIKSGCQILGYIYWSLIDNYEWDKGFSPRFGLIDVDYATYKRTVRQSAKNFALVCQKGEV